MRSFLYQSPAPSTRDPSLLFLDLPSSC